MVLSELTSDAGTRRVAKDRTGPPYGRRYERQHIGGGDVHDLEENGLIQDRMNPHRLHSRDHVHIHRSRQGFSRAMTNGRPMHRLRQATGKRSFDSHETPGTDNPGLRDIGNLCQHRIQEDLIVLLTGHRVNSDEVIRNLNRC